jgi:lysophospholipase L1-like esterase
MKTRLSIAFILTLCASAHAEQYALQASKESYDYAPAMKEVAKKFKGTQGVIVLMGDSITYANQNTAWALAGAGQSAEVKAFLKWSHAGERNDLDGYHNARVDMPGNRSNTAASGVTTGGYLNGGHGGLPALSEILKKFNPQMVVYMLGTNDVKQGQQPAAIIPNVEKSLDAILANGTIPILSTIPPMTGKNPQVEAYNAELKKLAEKKKIPLLDLFGEMKAVNADLDKWLSDGVHLTFANAGGAPTAENFKNAGYLLRCYCNIMKMMEVKARVIDAK